MDDQPSEPAAAPPSPARSNWQAFLTSPGGKLGMILILFLLMEIPTGMVSGLVYERQTRQEGVRAEFRTSWGPDQVLRGPILVIPFLASPTASNNRLERQYLHIAPETLDAAARITPKTRARGIFQATLYTADIGLKGSFHIREELLPRAPAVAVDKILWSESFVLMGASSWNGARTDAGLTMADKLRRFEDGRPSAGAGCSNADVIVARVPLSPEMATDTVLPFETSVTLAGTEKLNIALASHRSTVRMQSAWPSPAFEGAFMPTDVTVGEPGFDAAWRDSGHGRGISDAWTRPSPCFAASAPQVGVQLPEALPVHRMVYRASNYASLFMVLSFLTYFLFEVTRGVRIHIIQYGLLGLSMSLFSLLLISLAEPFGFTAGYVISTLAVLAQATLFTGSVTRRAREAGIFGAVLSGLFGLLYIIVSRENYALLAGSIALFAALSAVMLATRHLDWSKRLG